MSMAVHGDTSREGCGELLSDECRDVGGLLHDPWTFDDVWDELKAVLPKSVIRPSHEVIQEPATKCGSVAFRGEVKAAASGVEAVMGIGACGTSHPPRSRSGRASPQNTAQ